MRLKTGLLGFGAAMLLLLFICAKGYAAEISAASGAVTQDDAAYYRLEDPERYTLIHEMRLVNTGADFAYGINVRVALMDKATPLYCNRLREQLMPWPDSISTDEFGRRVAYYYYEKLAPGQELLFTQKYVLECGGISYPKLSLVSQGGYEEQLAAQYLLPSPGIESDNMEIIAYAQEVAGSENDTYAMAKAAFAEINRYLTYAEEDMYVDSPDRGALRTLHRAKGVCEDYSKLYVAVLRALGIAARQQSGYLYLPQQHNQPPHVDEEGRLNLNLLRHAWAEFYLPGKGWVIADPTFTYSFEVNGQLTKFINWDYFAAITPDRRYIFVREESLNEDKTLKYYAASNGHLIQHSINGYLLQGSQAAYFNDLEGHWAREAIMRLSELKEPLLQGIGNGMFGVSDPLTRAQLVTCLQRLMKSPPAGPKFTDLSPSHWAYRDIGAAQQAGWISGYPDQTFRPDKPVSRAELAQLLVTVFELTVPVSTEEAAETAEEEAWAGKFTEAPKKDAKAEKSSGTEGDEAFATEIGAEDAPPLADAPKAVFLDLGQPGYEWADEAITTLFLLGFAQGDGQGYFQPQRAVTRAEFATFLDRIISAREQTLE